MKTVVAIQSFQHSGPRRRGDVFEVSDQTADKLTRAGLVRSYQKAAKNNPLMAVGEKPSASPAVRVSRRRTAKKSKRGESEVTSEA